MRVSYCACLHWIAQPVFLSETRLLKSIDHLSGGTRDAGHLILVHERFIVSVRNLTVSFGGLAATSDGCADG